MDNCGITHSNFTLTAPESCRLVAETQNTNIQQETQKTSNFHCKPPLLPLSRESDANPTFESSKHASSWVQESISTCVALRATRALPEKNISSSHNTRKRVPSSSAYPWEPPAAPIRKQPIPELPTSPPNPKEQGETTTGPREYLQRIPSSTGSLAHSIEHCQTPTVQGEIPRTHWPT